MISREFHYIKMPRIRNPYRNKITANQKNSNPMYNRFLPGDTFNIQKKVLLILPFLMREASPVGAMLLSFFCAIF